MHAYKNDTLVYYLRLEILQVLLEINILLLVGKHELFDIIGWKNTFNFFGSYLI